MKNSKEYSKKVLALYRRLKRDHGVVEKTCYETVLDALVYAVISEKMVLSP